MCVQCVCCQHQYWRCKAHDVYTVPVSLQNGRSQANLYLIPAVRFNASGAQGFIEGFQEYAVAGMSIQTEAK